MKLLSLILDNFKGIKHFELEPFGSSMDIFGDNATGKTTLSDAYFWLLFGKDSAGRSDSNFDVKTRGTSGLDYSVSGTFQKDDGTTFVLKRVYKEVFTRKNGEAEREYKGNTTDFFINEVPKPKKDYTAFVFAICDEQSFMLLTDPDMFPGKMKWDERRDMLIKSFAPDIDDREIINAHDELKPLLNYIGYKTVDDYAEITKAQRQKINKQLADIPGRIDEAEKAKPFDIPTADDGPELLRLSKTKLQMESALQKIRNGESASAMRKKIADLQADLSTARAEHLRKFTVGNNALDAEAATLRADIGKLKNIISSLQFSMQSAKEMADGLSRELDELREKCVAIHNREFDVSLNVCPTCGREYPEEKRNGLLEKFNEDNANKQDQLEAIGLEKAQTRKNLLATAEEEKKKLQAAKQSLENANTRLEELTKAYATPPAFETTAEYKKLQVQISAAEHDLATVDAVATKQSGELSSQLAVVIEQIDAIKQRMTSKSIVEQQDKRISELKAQETELAQTLATYDNGLLLAEKFVQTKAQDIEQKVNSAFRLVRWKLFDIQVNGGVKACCEATVKGIEYTKNLNSASKLNAGLDIINTLSRTVGISVPVWIDNAESVTSYFPINAQIIRLHVSARDKQLRVEVR